MANICHIIPKIRKPDGTYGESDLFKKLLDLSDKDRDKAKRMYEEIHEDEFLDWFGDWLNNPEKIKDKLDENGEPKFDEILNYQFKDFRETTTIPTKEQEYTNLFNVVYTDKEQLEKAFKQIPGFSQKYHKERIWVLKDSNGSNHYGEAVYAANRINRMNPGLISIRLDGPASAEAGRQVWYPAINEKLLKKQLEDIDLENVPERKMSETERAVNKEKVASFIQEVKNRQGEIVSLLGYLKKDTDDQALLNVINMVQQKVKGPKEFFAVMSNELKPVDQETMDHFEDENIVTLMEIGPNGRTILINEAEISDYSYDTVMRAFVHEVFHMYTAEAARNPVTGAEKVFAEKIEKLFKTAKKNTANSKLYGYIQISDFIADAISDRRLIRDLKDQPFNLLQRIWNAIFEFFGGTVDYKFYNEIRNTIYDFVENHATFRGPNAVLTERKVVEAEEESKTRKEKRAERKAKREKKRKDREFAAEDQDLRTYFEKGEDITTLEELNKRAAKTLEAKRRILERTGELKQTVQSQQRLINKLSRLKSFRGAIEFVREASKFIDTEYQEYKQNELREKEGDYTFDIQGLSRMRESIEAFDVLDKYLVMFQQEKGVSPTSERWGELFKLMQEAINNKNIMKAAYEIRGMDLLVDFLEPHYNGMYRQFEIDSRKRYAKLSKAQRSEISEKDFVDKDTKANHKTLKERTRTLLRQELKRANRDINLLTRYADNMLDTKDPVIAAMVEAFTLRDHQSKEEAIKMSDVIVEKLRKLEKSFPQGALTDLRDSYDFMLEKIDGEYTQHYITPWLSSFQEAWFEKVEETKNLPEKERDSLRKEWKDANAPLDSERFKAAKEEYLNQLVEDGRLTEKELSNYQILESYAMKPDTDLQLDEVLEELINNNNINPSSANLISKWIFTNVWNYREPATVWRNSQWENLVELSGGDTTSKIVEQREQVKSNITKDPRVDFYNLIVKINEEANQNIPFAFRINSRLPGIEKDLAERAKEGQNPANAFIASLEREFTVRKDETERGNKDLTDADGTPKRFLPIHFTAQVDVVDQSWDIPTLYHKFWSMANDYSLKHEILPEMEMTKFFVDQRDAIERDRSGGAKKKKFTDSIVDYITTEKGKTNIAGQFNDWFLMAIYGKKEKEEDKFSLGDVEIDVAKFADFMNKYTALNLLGLNFTQGAANIILGETLQLAEAIAKEYIDLKSYHKATRVYTEHLPGMLGDIGLRRPKNVISLLIEHFDVLHEYESFSFRKSNKFRNLMTSNTLFFMQHSGEHWMQGRFLLAFLDHKRALDKDGNDIGSILDNYTTKDGKLAFKDGVDLEKSGWSAEEQRLFGIKVRGVLSRLHGEYSDLGRVALQRSALGRMAYMFRKFMIPGFKRRWGKSGYVQRLDDVVEGSYRSFGRFFGKFMKDIYSLQFHMIGENWRMLTRHEKANIHRTLVEINALTAAIILGNVALTLKGESDDDKEQQWWSFAAYQMLRVRAELLFFTPKIDEALSILRSPMASMSVIENTAKLLGQMFDPLTSGSFQFDRYVSGPWKGEPKLKRTMIQMTPGFKQMYRMRDIGNQVSFFQN